MPMNLGYFWIPHGVILGLLYFTGTRNAVLSGCALALTAHLVALSAYAHVDKQRDGILWLWYLFSMPGAALGAIAAALAARTRPHHGAVSLACIAAVLLVLGVLVNQVIVCASLLSCGFRDR